MSGAPMQLPEVLDIAMQIAGALAAAHAGGHRASRHQAGKHHDPARRHRQSLDFGLAKLAERRVRTDVDAGNSTDGRRPSRAW